MICHKDAPTGSGQPPRIELEGRVASVHPTPPGVLVDVKRKELRENGFVRVLKQRDGGRWRVASAPSQESFRVNEWREKAERQPDSKGREFGSSRKGIRERRLAMTGGKGWSLVITANFIPREGRGKLAERTKI